MNDKVNIHLDKLENGGEVLITTIIGFPYGEIIKILNTHIMKYYQKGIKNFALTFSHWHYCGGSTGFGGLIGTAARLEEKGCNVVFFEVPFEVYLLFDMFQLTETFTFCNSLKDTKNYLEGDKEEKLMAFTSFEKALEKPEKVDRLILPSKLPIIPQEIEKFTQLSSLDLSENNLTYLPKEIGTLKKLQYLNLSRNKLCELPKEIENLKNLKELYLFINNISELPLSLLKLSNLQRLRIRGNPFYNESTQKILTKHLPHCKF